MPDTVSLSNIVQLIVGIAAIAVTISAIYAAVKVGGLTGVVKEVKTLSEDNARLDRLESLINLARNDSPQSATNIENVRTLVLDIVKTIQEVQMEALKIGLVLPYSKEAADLLAATGVIVDKITDQLPNVPPAAGDTTITTTISPGANPQTTISTSPGTVVTTDQVQDFAPSYSELPTLEPPVNTQDVLG